MEPQDISKNGLRGSLVRLVFFSSLSVFLFSLEALSPFLGFWSRLATPLPLALLGYRDGLKWMRGGTLLAAAVLLGMFPLSLSLYFLLGYVPLAFALVHASRRSWQGSEALLMCVLVSILAELLLLCVFFSLTGRNLLVPDAEALSRSYAELPLQEGQAAALREALTRMGSLLPYIVPSMILLSSGLHSAVNYRLCEYFQRGRPQSPPSLPPFTDWRFSKTLLPALFLSYFLGALWTPEEWLEGAMFAVNLKLVLNILFFVEGLSLAFWWVDRRKFKPAWRFMTIFILMIPVMWLWLIFLGIADIVFDVRARARRGPV